MYTILSWTVRSQLARLAIIQLALNSCLSANRAFENRTTEVCNTCLLSLGIGSRAWLEASYRVEQWFLAMRMSKE